MTSDTRSSLFQKLHSEDTTEDFLLIFLTCVHTNFEGHEGHIDQAEDSGMTTEK